MTSGERAEIREIIASESLYKIHTKFDEVAGRVGRAKTEPLVAISRYWL